MQLFFKCLFLLGFSFSLSAQSGYFQQDVAYRIKVSLDDSRHQLSGAEQLTYTNHSPDTLTHIWFHLWPNAYKTRETAFAQQQIRFGNASFHFAKDSDLGGFDSIAFFSGKRALDWAYHPTHVDIASVQLADPLPPGASVDFFIPFQLDIPYFFSRLGHVDQSYFLTQWYPKPAVYDREGWHPMPYLDTGEFYSEFGSFEVEITLPENYVVAATGMLQTPDEMIFLEKRLRETDLWFQAKFDDFSMKTPVSSSKQKTIRFTADRVHDFAWFADKRFMVLQDSCMLPDEHAVKTWAFFLPDQANIWQKAPRYLNRSLQFFSEQVGSYPYPQMTAVQSPRGNFGGMEYPMITTLTRMYLPQSLDETIAHEVGHNWFQGILGSNERAHAWMDEGITSFYEQRYTAEYYRPSYLAEYIGFWKARNTTYTPLEYEYLKRARPQLEQPPSTPAGEMEEANYYLGAYEKPAWGLQLLEKQWGAPLFDSLMQVYFEKWKFKHPYPADLQAVLETGSGKDLDWFFQGILGSAQQLDYALKDVRKIGDNWQLEVWNKSKLATPFSITGMGADTLIRWYDPVWGGSNVQFPAGSFQQFLLDQPHLTPDINRNNNSLRTHNIFRKINLPAINWLWGVEHGEKPTLFFTPFPAWNNYDKLMLGLALYNHSTLPKTFEWELAPMLSTTDWKLGGLAGMRYHSFPVAKKAHRLTLALSARRFAHRYNFPYSQRLRYDRLAFSTIWRWQESAASTFTHELGWRLFRIRQQRLQFEPWGSFNGTTLDKRWTSQLQYRGKQKPDALRQLQWQSILEYQPYTLWNQQQTHYLRWEAELKTAFAYRKNSWLHARVFAGAMLFNDRRNSSVFSPGAFNLTGQGFANHDDYLYEELYLGRNESEGFFARQISIRDGGFKNAFPAAYSNQSGNSNSAMLSLNLAADLPLDFQGLFWIQAYADLAYAHDARIISTEKTFEEQLWASGGLSLRTYRDVLRIYVPLMHSKNIRDLYGQAGLDGVVDRITFSLRLERVWESVVKK